jgi:hypothetical protein
MPSLREFVADALFAPTRIPLSHCVSFRRSGGSGGRPVLRDFHRQNSLNSARCQRTRVSGLDNRMCVSPGEQTAQEYQGKLRCRLWA